MLKTILLTLSLICLMSCGSPKVDEPVASVVLKTEPLLKIADSVETTGKLSAEDRKLLLAKADDPTGDFSERHSATLALWMAVEKKAFPKAELLQLVERNAVAGDGNETTMCAREYWNILPLPMNPGSKFSEKAEAIRNEELDASTFAQNEVDLLKELFASGGLRDKGYVSELLLEKRKLDSKSLELARSYIDAQLGSAKNAELKYWQFVDRAVQARN